MNDERYKQIMADLGMPDSRSLLAALQQVANEVAQETQAAAVAMERERFVSLLTEKRDAATVSKYATSRDCVTARGALDDAINAIRQGA